jgi:Flp pilus assembly pilin Flp
MSGQNPHEQRRAMNPRAVKPGQAMVEYMLIAVLVALAIVVAVSATGPAVGNVFSNTVNSLLGQTVTPYKTWDANAVSTYAKAYGQFTPPFFTFEPNTPAAPTCQSNLGVYATPDGNGGFRSC